MSDIETYTLRKLTYKESFPQDIEFSQATAEIMPSVETDEKCLPFCCKGGDTPLSQIPTVSSPSLTEYGDYCMMLA